MSLLLNAGVKCSFIPGIQQFHRLKPVRCLSTIENTTNEREEESKAREKTVYCARDIEQKWYEFWESRNYFKPRKTEDSFTVLLPPPNITGTLHLGHALTCTLQDIIVRWKRMKGESVLWVPGIDHAGIATQVAVEKYLRNLGSSRHDLGREKFVNAIWEWKDEKEQKILNQLRRLGASLDWSKLIFTLDPSHTDLVNKSFIQLYNDGLIYRKESLVNWSCALKSSISDIEVETIAIDKATSLTIPGYKKPVVFGKLYQFAYKLYNEDDEIVVATTRPETMLGDVAIAIHPDSKTHSRFKHKYAWHPFRNEKIPIIEDEFVNPDLGTGAVKITPSHSHVDFEIGVNHLLPRIPVIGEDGCINNINGCEEFHKLGRFDARWAIIRKLKQLNLYRGEKPHTMRLGMCSRSGDVVELLLKDQWFLKTAGLVEEAKRAVESGDLELIPGSYKNVWHNWLSEKLQRDWNLSRQLWWGHQVPMYECSHQNKTVWMPGLSQEDAISSAAAHFGAPPGEITAVQDPDVLDTWFSSGLLSLNNVIHQGSGPPISLMVTGYDILFFWLARMVMLSLHLKGQLPFKKAFLHGLICDDKGKKMSKSVGNVINPEDIITGASKEEVTLRLNRDVKDGRLSKEDLRKALAYLNAQFPSGIPECGADALRFTLFSASTHGAVTNFDIRKCKANHFFCNKIYQGFNYFTIMAAMYRERRSEFDLEDVHSARKKFNYFDLWILNRLDRLIESIDTKLDSYKFALAANDIKIFLVEDFCNFYLNSTKAVVENCSPDQFRTTISVFFHCFETFLRLLSPVMPFLTEHLYNSMPLLNGYEKYESIMVAKYPRPSGFRDDSLDSTFEKLLQLLSAVRRVKFECHLKDKPSNVLVKCPDDVAKVLFCDMDHVFGKVAGIGTLTRVGDLEHENVIRAQIEEDLVVLIQHNHDKATLSSVLEPIIRNENSLKESFRELNKTRLSAGWDDLSVTQKNKVSKDMMNLQADLKRIDEYKTSLQNCNR